MFKYYAGIGSRQTPPDICRVFTELSKYLSEHEEQFRVRSGHAPGADVDFELDIYGEQIFVPWRVS